MKAAGPQENFANELNALGSLQFDFPDRSTPLETCMKLAGKIRKIPDEDHVNIVKHSYVRTGFDPKLMNEIGAMLCDLDRVNIFLHTQEECLTTEKWMNTKYDIDEVGDEFWNVLNEPRMGV